MKSYQKLSIMFWLFKAKTDKNGFAPIYVKLTIEGQNVDLSVGKKVKPEFWDEKAKEDLSQTKDAKATNARITEVKIDLDRHFEVLQTQYERVTPQMIKNRFTGRAADWSALAEKKEKEAKRTLLAAADEYMKDLEIMVQLKQRTKSTKTTWKTSYKHLTDFVKYFTKGAKDIDLELVNKSFASEYVKYLTLYKEEPLQPISAEKKIIHLKAFVDFACDKDWIDKNRLKGFSFNPEETKKKGLEYSEVISIYSKEFQIPRLEKIRDLFVFQCFTGFAYGDFRDLKQENLLDYGDGQRWLIRGRNKTDGDEMVPLLPIVEELIKKYADHPTVKKNGVLMPVLSNQKYNGYLKEIGTLCNVSQELTTHLARHTFSHLMLNVCYLPIEDVGKMLGHNSPKSTSRYCQVGKERLQHHMKGVQGKLFDAQSKLKINLAS